MSVCTSYVFVLIILTKFTLKPNGTLRHYTYTQRQKQRERERERQWERRLKTSMEPKTKLIIIIEERCGKLCATGNETTTMAAIRQQECE